MHFFVLEMHCHNAFQSMEYFSGLCNSATLATTTWHLIGSEETYSAHIYLFYNIYNKFLGHFKFSIQINLICCLINAIIYLLFIKMMMMMMILLICISVMYLFDKFRYNN